MERMRSWAEDVLNKLGEGEDVALALDCKQIGMNAQGLLQVAKRLRRPEDGPVEEVQGARV